MIVAENAQITTTNKAGGHSFSRTGETTVISYSSSTGFVNSKYYRNKGSGQRVWGETYYSANWGDSNSSVWIISSTRLVEGTNAFSQTYTFPQETGSRRVATNAQYNTGVAGDSIYLVTSSFVNETGTSRYEVVYRIDNGVTFSTEFSGAEGPYILEYAYPDTTRNATNLIVFYSDTSSSTNEGVGITTVATGGGWSTALTTTADSYTGAKYAWVGTSEVDLDWDNPRTSTRPAFYFWGDYTVVDQITRSVWAAYDELLIVLPNSTTPITAGSTAMSRQFVITQNNCFQAVLSEWIGGDGGYEYTELLPVFISVSYAALAESALVDYTYRSALTTSVVAPMFKEGEESTQEITTAFSVAVTQAPAWGGPFRASSSGFTEGTTTFETYESVPELYMGTATVPYQYSSEGGHTWSSYIYEGSNSASARTEIVAKLAGASYPVSNAVYIVAKTRSGWVIPDQGFHTRSPAKTLQNTFNFFTSGQARPGVTLYPPLGAATPVYPTMYQKWKIAGRSPLVELVPYLSDIGSTVAFTQSITQAPGFSVSPNVFKISSIGASVANISTVTPQGAASFYADGASYIGGYADGMPVTWTLVVGSPGVIVEYCGEGAPTYSTFSKFTTSTYAGSEGSFISFIPQPAAVYNYGSPVVATTPRYNYDEF